MQPYSQYSLHNVRLVVNDFLHLIEQDEEAIQRHQESNLLKSQYEALRMRHIQELADVLKNHYQLHTSPLSDLPLF